MSRNRRLDEVFIFTRVNEISSKHRASYTYFGQFPTPIYNYYCYHWFAIRKPLVILITLQQAVGVNELQLMMMINGLIQDMESGVIITW